MDCCLEVEASLSPPVLPSLQLSHIISAVCSASKGSSVVLQDPAPLTVDVACSQQLLPAVGTFRTLAQVGFWSSIDPFQNH